MDEYLDLIVRLMTGALTEAYGTVPHVTVFVGASIDEVKVRSTLSDDQLLLLLTAFSEHMALKHSEPAGQA